jgi:hypothetical protein
MSRTCEAAQNIEETMSGDRRVPAKSTTELQSLALSVYKSSPFSSSFPSRPIAIITLSQLPKHQLCVPWRDLPPFREQTNPKICVWPSPFATHVVESLGTHFLKTGEAEIDEAE